MPPQTRLPLAALMGRAQLRYVAEFDELLATAGYPDLSLAHGANVLRHLGSDGPASMRELVAGAAVSKQAVSQQVSLLVQRGYVLSTVDPDDLRSRLLELTASGRECLATYRATFAVMDRRWRRRYGTGTVDALRAALEHVLAVDQEPGSR